MGATTSLRDPQFDQNDGLMLICTPALGAALARSLADKPMVLMRGHGATIVATLPHLAVYHRDLRGDERKLQEVMRPAGDGHLTSTIPKSNTAWTASRPPTRAWGPPKNRPPGKKR